MFSTVGDVVALRAEIVGVAEVDDLQVLEDVEVEVLHVAGVADRLLAHALRTGKPQRLVDTAVGLRPSRPRRARR